ncbi:MAG: phosphatase PAP2 family protein [Clostridia bacterium]
MNMINFIDEKTYELIIKLMSNGMTNFMLFMSHLGSAITLIILTIGFILLLKNKINSKSIAINLILVFILNRILKFIIARPRPEVLRIVEEKGYSFPSGHSMVATGFYGFLIYLVYKNIKNKKIKYPLIVMLSVLILLIGISRIYLGAHYATDVIGGWIIGIVYLAFFIKYAYKKMIKKSKKIL